ncbi:MAG: hypothetical protein KIS86_06425 [Devosia sp.]|nr:hypothetical protein [Devosia sp.]
MTLNSERLEKAIAAYNTRQDPAQYATTVQDYGVQEKARQYVQMSAAISACLSALPPVDGLEVVAWDVAPKGLPAEPTKSLSFVVEIERQGGVISPLVTLSQASSVIAGLKEEVERCHARLEIDHEWVVGGNDDSGLERREIPIEERASQIDGIECRDATITELEREVERLTAQLTGTARVALSIDGEAQEMSARISFLEEENKRLREALGNAERSFNNIRGAIESNQVIDKDAHGTAIRARDAARQALEDHNG